MSTQNLQHQQVSDQSLALIYYKMVYKSRKSMDIDGKIFKSQIPYSKLWNVWPSRQLPKVTRCSQK